MTDFEALVLLNMVDGLGSVRVKKLLELYGVPSKIFEIPAHDLHQSGILTPLMVRRLADARARCDVQQEIEEAQRLGIRLLTILDQDYPLRLKEIYDPPVVLYVKGKIASEDSNAIGVVGSRGASYYGLSCAQQFSSSLAHWGITIVSGLARGVDTTSHRACLDTGGRTLAVVGSGLNVIYPPENKDLFYQIAEHGAVLSQFPLNTPPLARNFPVRNRIISGLSLGVLVVEATAKSGALITARYALEQGREVFAIPGKTTSPTSCGTNELIKQGARMVTEPKEILEDLRFNFSTFPLEGVPASGENSQGLNQDESRVLDGLSDEPLAFDELIFKTGLSIPSLSVVLTRLELKKIIKQLPGKNFVKTC